MTLDLKLYVTTRFKFKFKLIQFDSVIVKCALIFKFLTREDLMLMIQISLITDFSILTDS